MNIDQLKLKFPDIPRIVIVKIHSDAYDLACLSTNGRPNYDSADKSILNRLESYTRVYKPTCFYNITLTDERELKGVIGLIINFYNKNKEESQPEILYSKEVQKSPQ